MEKIARIEKELDPKTTSSFYPSEFKRSVPCPGDVEDDYSTTRGAQPGAARWRAIKGIVNSTEGLQDSELFLPCHYFSYIGGTSTGGYVVCFHAKFEESQLILQSD